jgi:PKD repeat protein
MNASKVQNDGDDIVFTDNQGIKLNHEIESYDSDTGLLIAWVNITSLNSISDTVLWIYYSNPLCYSQQNKAGTWDSNYVAVWHFGETVGSIVSDSTINHFNATASSYTTVSDGFIGKARSFDAGNGEIDAGTHEEFGGMPSYSIETYAFPYSITGEQRIFDRSESYGSNPNTINLYLANNGLLGLVTNNYDGVFFYNALSINTWKYITGVYSGSGGEQALYVNGTKIASGTTSFYGPTAGSFNVHIGDCAFGWGLHWNGKLDEMRFSKISRTSSWIATSYNTMSSPSTFISIGVEEVKSIPFANFTYIPLNPTNTTIVQFTDTSTDINGVINAWWWNFGDDTFSDLQNPTHCFYVDGVYNVTLTVTDNYNVSNITQKTIIVYTPPNHPPNVPANPVPDDGAINVPIDIVISWTGGDPDGDPVTYDVYFGTISPPPKIISNQSETFYHPGTLGYNTTYYWKIIAWDNNGNHANGLVWHFRTILNLPPNAPIINGPTSGKIGQSYDYTFVAVDPDNDNIYYEINWGDGHVDDWYGPVESNAITTRSHTWSEKGSFTIQARAKDIHGAIGEWGSLSVTMPMDLISGYQQSQQIISFQLKKIMS